MSRRTGALAVCALLLAMGQSRAGQEAPAVALEYSAVSECPDAAEFRATVVGRLGYDAFREGVSSRVAVDIAPREHGLEGRIEWRDAEGNWEGDRTFPSRTDDCRELARAMAFALALQIQFSADQHTPAEANAPAPAGTEPATQAPVAAAAPPAPASKPPEVTGPNQAVETPEPGVRPTIIVGGGALGGFGLSPGVVPHARLFGSLAWPLWALELAAEITLPATIRREDGAGFSHQQILVTGAGCGTLQPWSLCVVAKAGQVRIVGRDIDAPASPSGLALQTGMRLAISQSFWDRAYVAAYVEGLAMLTRWRVNLDRNLVWTSPRFAETLGLDVGVRFP